MTPKVLPLGPMVVVPKASLSVGGENVLRTALENIKYFRRYSASFFKMIFRRGLGYMLGPFNITNTKNVRLRHMSENITQEVFLL